MRCSARLRISRRPSEVQEKPHQNYSGKEVPQEQPVAAFKIGVGAGALRRRHLGEVCLDRRRNIKLAGSRSLVRGWRNRRSTGRARPPGCKNSEQQNDQKNRSACPNHHDPLDFCEGVYALGWRRSYSPAITLHYVSRLARGRTQSLIANRTHCTRPDPWGPVD